MNRLIVSLLLVVLIATIGFGWTLDQLFREINAGAGDTLSNHQSHGQQVALLLDAEKSIMLEKLSLIDDDLNFAIVGLDSLPLPDELRQQITGGDPLALESEDGVTLYYYLPKAGQVLSYAPPAFKHLQRKNRQKLYFTILFYAGLIGLTLLWLYPLVTRLMNLSRVARRFGEGDFSSRIVPATRSYISDIENEFNQMAHRIETLISDNKLLTSAVSHDLRTPIARLRFGVDAVMETDSQEVRLKYLNRISDDLTAMEDLVEAMLNFARMDQQLNEVEMMSLNLPDCIERAVRSFEPDDIIVEWERPTDKIYVNANEHYLGMLINNLISNGLRHAESRLLITLESSEGNVVIHIDDDGPGIAEDDRERLQRPFERNLSDSAGYGMGLAIVTRIADSHDGEFNISDSVHIGGASMQVRLPEVNISQANTH